MANRTDVVIIGAGQAGLAMSQCLTENGIAHVVLERGLTGESWRSERWHSLRLLTPNWMTRLPGFSYEGSDPHGFMHRDDVVRFLDTYRERFGAPVSSGTTVRKVVAVASGFRISTDCGEWLARCVVVATGACARPDVPVMASELAIDIEQVVPEQYKRPEELRAGGVLVVGASATGIQLADEIHRSGRPVTIAAGRHVRVPRTYRGRDIMAWLDACGFLDERRLPGADGGNLAGQPSFQLAGSHDRRNLSLPRLADRGVKVIGRLTAISGATLAIADDLATECAAAEGRRHKLLARIDSFIAINGIEAPEDPIAWLRSREVGSRVTRIDLRTAGIRTVVWATGYKREYPWLDIPVLDDFGDIRNAGGITDVPGLYVIGMPFMRRRSSSFIDGVGRDAEELVTDVARRLRHLSKKAA